MMRAALILTLLAAPAFAQESVVADVADVAALTKAIEDAGCTVTSENGDAVLAASGLSEEETFAVITTLYADGLVGLEADGTMSLSTEACE
jgi:hypothetical protein